MRKNTEKRRADSMSNPYLIGKHVYLRAVEKDDAAEIQKWHNDPDIRKLSRCGGLPVSRTSEEEDIEAARTTREVYLLIVQKASDNHSVLCAVRSLIYQPEPCGYALQWVIR